MNSNLCEKIPVIAVVGPTASGKTALSVALAKHFDAEIVSADSMQIYKGMNIASAKPTTAEMCGIKHHMMDFLAPNEKYSVAKYVSEAGKVIDDITSRGKKVLVCGGTGLYIDSLLQNITFAQEEDNTEIRLKLRERREKEGIETLYNELMMFDPDTAKKLHINNEGRILRAIERYMLTGEKPSELDRRSKEIPSLYKCIYIGLEYENREVLYDRINKRVDTMIENGLVKEAEEYFSLTSDNTSAQAIGHKELVPFLNGEIPLEEAVENLKRATRRYAKRQMTWFRRNKEINTLYCDKYPNFDAIVTAAVEIIEKSELFAVGENH